MRRALIDAAWKLDPRRQVRNPVMFTVLVGSVLTTALGGNALVTGDPECGFIFGISAWLWFTVLFANFAEAMAEGRGKAQADSLRQTRREVTAKKLVEPRHGAKVEFLSASRCAKATWCWWKQAIWFPPMEKSSTGWLRSMKAR
jgi:K+-transporting ATPase ATPase B chain